MRCPIDQSNLETQQNLKICPKCSGHFFLKDEFAKYLNFAARPDAEVIKQQLKSIVAGQPAAAGYRTTNGRPCPNCSELMHKQNYSYDSNVFIDSCPACKAIWLDNAEANKMVAHLAAGNEFEAVGNNIGENATKGYFYKSGKGSSEDSRVYPYSPGRTATLGLVGGHPEVQYREHMTLASLVRWPLLWLVAKGLIILTWIAYIVMQSSRSIITFITSVLVLIACYSAMAIMSRWAKKEQALIREAEKSPFERS